MSHWNYFSLQKYYFMKAVYFFFTQNSCFRKPLLKKMCYALETFITRGIARAFLGGQFEDKFEKIKKNEEMLSSCPPKSKNLAMELFITGSNRLLQVSHKKKNIVWLSTSNRPWFWKSEKRFVCLFVFFFSILLYKRIPTLLLEIPEKGFCFFFFL